MSVTAQSLKPRVILTTLPVLRGSIRELEQQNHELALLVEMLQERVARLETEKEELEAFAHTVAHDLKGPVCEVAGYAGFVRDTYQSLSEGKRQQCLSMIHRGALRLGNIIDELLLLAGLSHKEVEIEPLDMASVVDRALDRLASMIEDREAEIASAPTWPVAVGYGPWIEEVWMNYIDNAVKYGGAPPRVQLGATRENGSVRFWVRDNGRGLPSEEQGLLFTPFTRLDQAHTKGHGLGLSIVCHVVEKLGGQVGVESRAGQGSTFSFTLPVEC
jgi:signal transduction histidine kinase